MLNTATKITLGDIEAERVYAGSRRIWPPADWYEAAGSWAIDEDGVYMTSAQSAPGAGLLVCDTGETDGAMSVSMSDPGTGNSANSGLALRVVDRLNFIYVRATPASALAFGEVVNGVVVGGEKIVSGAGNARSTLVLEFSGSSSSGGLKVRAITAGVERAVWTVTDPIFDGVTRHGMFHRSGTVRPLLRWRKWTFYKPGKGFGDGWEQWGTSTWHIDDGKAHRFFSYGDHVKSVTVTDTGISDGHIRTKMNAFNRAMIVFRARDEDNFLFFRAASFFSNWQLFLRKDGVNTELATFGGGIGEDYIVEVHFFQNKVRLRVNGGFAKLASSDSSTFVLPSEANDLLLNGKHGFGNDGNSPAGEYDSKVSTWSCVPSMNWATSGAQLMADRTPAWVGRQYDIFSLPMGYSSVAPSVEDAVAVMWGANDAIAMSAEWYLEGLIATISRIRAIQTIPASLYIDSLFSGSWSEVGGSSNAYGATWVQSSQVGDNFEIEFDPSPLMGYLGVGFVALNGGGTARITVNGVSTDIQTDRGEWSFEPIFCHRVELKEDAPTTIKVEVLSGTVAIDSFWVEPGGEGPRIAVANVAKFLHGADFTATGSTNTTVSYNGADWEPNEHVGATARIYEGPGAITDREVVSNTSDTVTVDSAWGTNPVPGQSRIHINRPGSPWGNITDRKIEDMNAKVLELESIFKNLTVIDIDRVMDRNPEMFSGDGIHPSALGHETLAKVFARAIGRNRNWRKLWTFGHSYATGQGGGSDGFDYHLSRFLNFQTQSRDMLNRSDKRGAFFDKPTIP